MMGLSCQLAWSAGFAASMRSPVPLTPFATKSATMALQLGIAPARSHPTGLLLSNRCAIRGVSTGSDILDPDRDDITATKLAVNRLIEHRKGPDTGPRSGASSGSTRRVWGAAVA